METRKLLTTRFEELQQGFQNLQELAAALGQQLDALREQWMHSKKDLRESEPEELHFFISLHEDPLPGLRPAV
ncbi:MAG: hypothetical protein ACFB10_08755 [Salibacteraceae bacterium]